MNKLFLLALCPVFLLPAVSAGSVLGDAAASMKAGEWRDLNASGMNYDMLNTDVNGAGTNPVTDYSDNLTWDPAGEEVLYVGSGNYYTYKFLRYSAATNAWRSDPNLPACMKNRGCNWHAFDNNSMDEVNRQYYFINSSGLWTYSVATSQWSSAVSLPSGMAQGVGSAMEYFPPLNGLASVLGGTVTVYNLSTRQVTTAATGLAMASYNQVATYSPVYRKFFFGGDGAGNFYGMDSAKKVTKLANAPGLLHELSSTLTTDPVTGKILYLGDPQSSSAGKLFAFNPETNAWSPAGNAPRAEHALATPISNHGVVLFLFPSSYKTFLYRHAAPTTGVEAPAGPMSRFSTGPVSVFDVRGRRVAEPASLSALDALNLPRGVYIAKQRGTAAHKFIIMQ